MAESTQNLFEQLGGTGTPSIKAPSPQSMEKPSAEMPGQDESLDRWRILLVELAYLLNASFQDAHYWEGVKAEKDTFRQFVQILRELEQMPVQDRIIRISFRGSQSTKVSDKIDYMIEYGDVIVDLPVIAALTRRMGLRVKHLEGRLQKSFEAFAAQGIKTLNVIIPEDSDESLEPMRVSLRVISCFNHAVETSSPIVYAKDGEQFSLLPITDELNQPDPNLTLVAALNGLRPETMRDLVQKVKNVMQGRNRASSDGQSLNIYQGMYKIKSLRQRLSKPPVEINSDKSTARGTHQAAGTAGAAGPSAGTGHGLGSGIDPGVVKARVAQFVKQSFGNNPENARQIMKSIYGRDFKKISQQDLGERLILVTDLLQTLEQSPKGQNLMQEVLGRIQGGMDQIPHELFDDLVVDNNEIKLWSDTGEVAVDNVDDRLVNVIDRAKQQSAKKKKMRTALNPAADFSLQDYETIARDFDISTQDAEEIISLFKSCFDGQDNFLRASFEKKVTEFARCKKKVFEILWAFLKETPRRNDRLPFLNSLQLLVKEIKNPIKAIKVLLTDFVMGPASIEYPDRNAMMLTNQFLRTYNKEINMDIEITPEEVLLVIEGLDTSVANYARWKVDGEQKNFFEKFVTIRKKLLQSLDEDSADDQHLPLRFLLALEREIHIFLSLVGGESAYTVVRGALNVYGNPESQVYHLRESRNNMSALLQHLAVLIRGFGRLGQAKDLALLDEVKGRQDGFLSLGDDTRHDSLVRRIIGWIDASQNNITSRNNKSPS
jgi:hypothetical protein